MGLALGDIAAKEVRSSNDVYSLMSEKKWIGHSHNSFRKYDFVNFPCIGPIVEALEEMGIQLIWGNCFEADNVGDKKFGYEPLKEMPESNFRFAYVFRNKYLNQRITYMRRNADGVFALY